MASDPLRDRLRERVEQTRAVASDSDGHSHPRPGVIAYDQRWQMTVVARGSEPREETP